MDIIEFLFALFFFAIIISWVICIIITIIQPNRFKKNNDNNDKENGPKWEQWPFN